MKSLDIGVIERGKVPGGHADDRLALLAVVVECGG